MMAKLKFKENGECVVCVIDTIEEGFETCEVVSMDFNDNHKEPYKSQFRYSKIKEKQKEIISRYSYIPGLSVGHQQDTAWKNWIESIILFNEQYKSDKSIVDTISFPADPLGNIEVLDFIKIPNFKKEGY